MNIDTKMLNYLGGRVYGKTKFHYFGDRKILIFVTSSLSLYNIRSSQQRYLEMAPFEMVHQSNIARHCPPAVRVSRNTISNHVYKTSYLKMANHIH